MIFKLFRGNHLEYNLHKEIEQQILKMCRVYNREIELTKLDYLCKHPSIDPDSDFSYPIKFKTEWYVGSFKLWHAEKNYNEHNNTFTHNLYLDLDDQDHYVYIDVIEDTNGNLSIYEIGIEEETQKIIHNHQDIFQPDLN